MADNELSVDHIDPQWKGGREYQLACGLDVDINLRVEDHSVNVRKSNRFVPYRVVDWLAVHQEPGDWGIFLIGGEWRLTQFMGHDWWGESSKIGCGTLIGAKAGIDALLSKNPGHQSYAASCRTSQQQSESGREGGVARHRKHPTLSKTTMLKTNAQKWCDPDHPELGITNAGALAKKQKSRGYPHGPANRVKVS
jgi:hypothetical protein